MEKNMNKIDEKFFELREKGEKALIPFFTAGFPSLEKTVEMVRMAEKSGADLVELGVPFSDPTADGPIIQHTSYKALEAGVDTDKIFGICAQLQKTISIPYLLMTYYNPVYKYGLKKFAARCGETGVSGIIIPDMPYEESSMLKSVLGQQDVTLVSFMTPFTSARRAEKILKDAGGFIYFVTAAGVTGPGGIFAAELIDKIEFTRKITGKPIAAGFGISGVNQIKMIKDHVDGVIVGSFFAKKIMDGKTDTLWDIIRRFKKALK